MRGSAAVAEGEALLDSGQLASWLNCGRQKVYELVREGMPHFKLGLGSKSEYRFDSRAVAGWLVRCGRANSVEVERRAEEPEDIFARREFIR